MGFSISTKTEDFSRDKPKPSAKTPWRRMRDARERTVKSSAQNGHFVIDRAEYAAQAGKPRRPGHRHEKRN